MCHKWFSAAVFLLITLISSPLSHAQSLKAEQAKLADLQQQLAEQQTQQQQLQSAIKSKQAFLAAMPQEGSAAKDKLDKTATKLAQAQAAYQADPSQSNKSRLKNTELKYALAEHKFRKATTPRNRANEETKDLNDQLVATTALISRLSTNINQQQLAIEESQTAQAATQKDQIRRLKAEAATAAAEIRRLKTQLAEQTRLKKACKAAALAAAAPAQAPAPAPAIIKTAKTAVPATASKIAGENIRWLINKEQVQTEEQRIQTLLATPDDKKHSKYPKTLHVKPASYDAKTGRATSTKLKFLGHSQYRGTSEFTTGEYILVVGINRWRITIPANINNVAYRVTYDGSDPENPQLRYWLKSLSSPQQ